MGTINNNDMIETWGEDMKSEQHGLIKPQIWMFDKDCTGNFKVVDIQDYHIIHQEVKRKKYIFFSETLYVPMTGRLRKYLITYSSDKAQTILGDVKKLYKPIHRAKVLAQVLR
jgi:hypothetical protein